MNLPVGGEEAVDVLAGKEVRRAMRAVDHPQLPLVADRRAQLAGYFSKRNRADICAQVQHVTGAQRAAVVATELTEGEGGFGTQIIRALQAAEHRQIGAGAGVLDAAEGQGLTGGDVDHLPSGNRLIIQFGVDFRTAQHDLAGAGKAQGRTLQGDFQPGGVGRVVQQAVAEAEGVAVERAGRRHADIPAAGAARKVLNGGLGAAGQHVDARRLEAEAVEVAGGDLACQQRRVAGQRAQVVEVGFAAVQAGRVQRVLQFA